MTTMTNDEWRQFVSEGARLGNAARVRITNAIAYRDLG
jgi:hypothetical protein